MLGGGGVWEGVRVSFLCLELGSLKISLDVLPLSLNKQGQALSALKHISEGCD